MFYFLQSCPNMNITVIFENTTWKTIPKFIHLQVNSHLDIVVTLKESHLECRNYKFRWMVVVETQCWHNLKITNETSRPISQKKGWIYLLFVSQRSRKKLIQSTKVCLLPGCSHKLCKSIETSTFKQRCSVWNCTFDFSGWDVALSAWTLPFVPKILNAI